MSTLTHTKPEILLALVFSPFVVLCEILVFVFMRCI